ncbi:MAG: AMP-binding protein [Desulfomonile sp.]|nr:AMP-binding protein [Desulfomonile sp.]
MGVYQFTVYSALKRNALIHGGRVALIWEGERITHRQLLDRVDRVACGLAATGVEKGDRLAVLAENSAEFIYLYGAAARIGAVMVPVNWRLKPDEVEFVISDVSPRVLFVGSNFHEMAAPLISRFGLSGRTYSMGDGAGEFAAFDCLTQNDGLPDEIEVSGDDAFIIIHTAAVAGRPRGAVISHGGVLINGLQLITSWQLTERDCNLGMLPLFHVTGVGFWLMLMQVGGSSVILPRFDADRALKHIEEDKVTVFATFPPILSTLLDRNQELKCDLSSLRAALGILEPPEVVQRFERESNATCWIAYGQSETSGGITAAPFFDRSGSAGLPGVMTEVRLMDDQGRFVETGQVGEIVVRSPVVFKGYWNLDEDTRHAFRDGWHHTGDMGRMDEEGYLYYAGRLPEKELIKPGGENVYPAEVEKAILEHPKVEEACVIGVRDPQWGEAIKAVCSLKQGQSLEAAELIEFVASRIARYKKPKHVVFVPGLPKTKDGAIDRAGVKAQHGDG